MRYILHYTKPGDIVLDGFCGTGMTGVAAQTCGHLSDAEEYALKSEMGDVEFGVRKAILNDLSPMATFLSSVYNSKINKIEFNTKLNDILDRIREKYGWMYETNHTEDYGFLSGLSQKGTIIRFGLMYLFARNAARKLFLLMLLSISKQEKLRTNSSARIAMHCLLKAIAQRRSCQ